VVGTAYVATADGFADALPAGAAAASRGAPLLLTGSTFLPGSTEAELRRLAPGEIVLVGGSNAISDAVESAIRALGFPVRRISGQDRFETATLVAREIPRATSAVIATGGTFADALAGVPLAAALHAPILLVQTGGIPTATNDYVRELRPRTIEVLGGTAAVDDVVAWLLGI
jgi:putative cell wall-binding protein